MQVIKEQAFDEVFDAQKNFRALLDGMSRPGKVFRLRQHGFTRNPECFNPNLLTVLKTLGDNSVTFSSGNMKDEQIDRYIEVNTGMNFEETNKADYVIFNGNCYDERICSLNPGSLEFPENSATVIFSVEAISNVKPDDSVNNIYICMSGPGIKEFHALFIAGLDQSYIDSIMELNSAFPLGVDIIYADFDGNIACMPRTTKAEVK